jgi:hypothetical protein
MSFPGMLFPGTSFPGTSFPGMSFPGMSFPGDGAQVPRATGMPTLNSHSQGHWTIRNSDIMCVPERHAKMHGMLNAS